MSIVHTIAVTGKKGARARMPHGKLRQVNMLTWHPLTLHKMYFRRFFFVFSPSALAET